MLLLAVGFTFLLNLIPTPSPWFIILWIFVALIISIILVVGFVLLFLKFAPRNNPKGKFRHFILRDMVVLFVRFYHVKLEVVGKENILKFNNRMPIYIEIKNYTTPNPPSLPNPLFQINKI